MLTALVLHKQTLFFMFLCCAHIFFNAIENIQEYKFSIFFLNQNLFPTQCFAHIQVSNKYLQIVQC